MGAAYVALAQCKDAIEDIVDTFKLRTEHGREKDIEDYINMLLAAICRLVNLRESVTEENVELKESDTVEEGKLQDPNRCVTVCSKSLGL